MAFDTELERRIDTLIAAWPDMEKKKMFGGVCYLLGGNIGFGIWRSLLIVRTTEDRAGRLLQREHTRPFDITGRPMKGWLMVAAPALSSAAALQEWLEIGRDFARTLPAK